MDSHSRHDLQAFLLRLLDLPDQLPKELLLSLEE